MKGKFLALFRMLGPLAGLVLQGAGLRYEQTCVVESAPQGLGMEQVAEEIRGEVSIGERASLRRNAKRSMLYRLRVDGVAETIEIDHSAKTWKILRLGKDLPVTAVKIRGVRAKVTQRVGLPERILEGYKATGSVVGVELEFSATIPGRDPADDRARSRIEAMMKDFRVSQETWVTRDIEGPLRNGFGGAGHSAIDADGTGVDVQDSRLEKQIWEIFRRVEGSEEAFAQMGQMGSGFRLETVLEFSAPSAGRWKAEDGKPIRLRISAKNIEKEDIPDQEFAIPETYRQIK